MPAPPQTTLQKASAAMTGSISPLTTLIVLACLACLTYLADAGKVNGDAIIAVIGGIIGAVLRGSGASDAAKANTDQPPG